MPTSASHWALAGALTGAVLVASCSEVVLPLVTAWEGSVEALTPGGPRGFLAVVSQAGRAQTSLQLTRGEAGTAYAWTIRTGSCAAPGDIVGGSAVYPRLTADADGEADGGTTLSRELSPDGAYAGWILLPSGGAEAPVACGALVRTR